MSANGQPPQDQQAPPIVPEDPAAVANALLIAIRRAAEDAAGSQDPREAQELGAAALSFAQAVVVLDPALSQGGTPLAHDLALEQVRQDGQARIAQIGADAQIRQAKEVAQAPTPARKLRVVRDSSGRASGIEEG